MGSIEEMIDIASKVNDGLRHLRNFAKKRGIKGIPILEKIFQRQERSSQHMNPDAQEKKFGLKPLGQDSTEIVNLLDCAFKEETMLTRKAYF